MTNPEPTQGKTVKPCPGLKGAVFCGKDRKGQGYCPDCRRTYQRNRYQNMANGAHGNYTPREHTRISAERCSLCHSPAQAGKMPIALAPPLEHDPICEVCFEWVQHLRKAAGINFLKSVHRFIEAKPALVTQLPSRTSKLILDKAFIEHLEGIQRRQAIADDEDFYPGKDPELIIGTPEWVDLKLAVIARSCENGQRPNENAGSKAMLDYNIWASRTSRPQYQEEFGLPRENYDDKPFHILTDMRLRTWFLLPANSDPDIRVEHENIVKLEPKPEYSRPEPTVTVGQFTTPITAETVVPQPGINTEDTRAMWNTPTHPPVEFEFKLSGPPEDMDNIPSPFSDD